MTQRDNSFISTHRHTPKPILREGPDYTKQKEMMELIRDSIGRRLSDVELELYVRRCQSLNIDPLAKQLYPMKRDTADGGTTLSFQASIELLRLIADRSGNYAGNDDPVFEYGSSLVPTKAIVTVRKIVRNEVREFSASAHWKEYYPGDSKKGFMWRKMPHVMLGKCAEALALRKAFPNDMAGIYSNEESKTLDDIDVEDDSKISPDKSYDGVYTVRAFSGDALKEEIAILTKRWKVVYPELNNDKSAFTAWAKATANVTVDLTDIKNWTWDIINECKKSLDDNTETVM